MPSKTYKPKMANMKKDLLFGSSIEKLAKQEIIPLIFPQCEITEVSKDSTWQKHGVDYVLKDTITGKFIFVEIKGDRRATGNIIAEDIIQRNKGGHQLGWAYTSKADYIIYVVVPLRKVLVFSLAEFRRIVQHGNYELKHTLNPWGTSYFYVIPIEELVNKHNFYTEVYEEDKWKDLLTKYEVPIDA